MNINSPGTTQTSGRFTFLCFTETNMAIYNVSVGDEMISLDRRYSHANSINCQIPVQTDASCRRKGTKWTIPRASARARFSVPF